MNYKNIFIIAILILAVGGGAYLLTKKPNSAIQNKDNFIASANYVCDSGKTISADFYKGDGKPGDANTPPTPGGKAFVSLNGADKIEFNQTISADGARYENKDGSIVFWSKGKGAFVTENDQQTYGGCIEVAPETENLSQIYTDTDMGFSLRYPEGYSVNDKYTYKELGPDKSINGVSFTVPASMTEGTNLASDTNISVEQLPSTRTCSADEFLPSGASGTGAAQQISENDTTYSVATSTGAGAGNRYDEIVYALPGTSPCTAVRYFIHYNVLENYPAGTVEEFDGKKLMQEFNEIRQSIILD